MSTSAIDRVISPATDDASAEDSVEEIDQRDPTVRGGAHRALASTEVNEVRRPRAGEHQVPHPLSRASSSSTAVTNSRWRPLSTRKTC
ncbi:hypothetical protein GS489_33820 [Rhodococcus hoagii]|nr:hypothetical protein [Prescottella equi]